MHHTHFWKHNKTNPISPLLGKKGVQEKPTHRCYIVVMCKECQKKEALCVGKEPEKRASNEATMVINPRAWLWQARMAAVLMCSSPASLKALLVILFPYRFLLFPFSDTWQISDFLHVTGFKCFVSFDACLVHGCGCGESTVKCIELNPACQINTKIDECVWWAVSLQVYWF